MIVLNDDTIVCEGCYEENKPNVETDPGLVPFAYGVSGECKNCGQMDIYECIDNAERSN